MKTSDIDSLLHSLKPDGHRDNPLVQQLRELANALQEQSDKAHALILRANSPQIRGEVVGELILWPDHSPLELDHSGQFLNDIRVRGVSVSEHLAAGLWEEADAYLRERFSPEITESTRRVIARMDKADLAAERSA